VPRHSEEAGEQLALLQEGRTHIAGGYHSSLMGLSRTRWSAEAIGGAFL